jgi:hypothetical protein
MMTKNVCGVLISFINMIYKAYLCVYGQRRQYKTKLDAASRSCSAFSFHTRSGTREAKV